MGGGGTVLETHGAAVSGGRRMSEDFNVKSLRLSLTLLLLSSVVEETRHGFACNNRIATLYLKETTVRFLSCQ